MTLSIVAAIALTSMLIMLFLGSPEFTWDEAAYAGNTNLSWRFLWSEFDYHRHHHGPLAIYLVKLGQELFPTGIASFEVRSRAFEALIASLSVGLLYAALRHVFKTSRAAALVGSGLLLFSAIRLQEADIIGPHHLMLACTLAMAVLAYHWRNRPSLPAALGLGGVVGFGALSMTYVVPVITCWILAVTVAGNDWLAWDRRQFKVSWWLPALLLVGGTIFTVLWPAGMFQRAFLYDFDFYLHFKQFTTLVGERVFDKTPRWAAGYWLGTLDAPMTAFSLAIILMALSRAVIERRWASRHLYLVTFLAFFLTTAVTAHIAGARNLLQFVGLLCLTAGALFDEALGCDRRVTRYGCALILVLTLLNVAWVSQSSEYIPSQAADGYRVFVQQNQNRLGEDAKALVYAEPALRLYAGHQGIPLQWDIDKVPWITHAPPAILEGAKYVLMPEFVYTYLPPEHPMRQVVAEHWKLIWSYKANHVWELRLYGNPQASAGSK